MSRPISCKRAAQRSTSSAKRVLQAPLGLDLLEQRDGGRLDAVRLHRVDVIAPLHGAHAAHARILVGEAAHEVVEQSLAHRAFGDAYAIDAEVLDDLQQDRETGRKHRRALRIDVLEIEIVHMPRGDHALGEAAQIVEQ